MYVSDKIEEIKARFDASDELLSSDKSFIESNYERILSKRFNKTGCGQCYHDAFIEIYIHIKQKGIKKMGKFILKREEVLHITGSPQVYTRANITDDVAAKYLKQFPNAIGRFEGYPDDWEKIISESGSGDTVLDSEEQIAAEKELVLSIAKMLKEGTSKTKIKEHYKSTEKVGEKSLTGVLVGEFIKQAEELIKSKSSSGDTVE